MTPNLGQGACQTIEDALVLARCFQVHPDVGTALQAYEAQCIARTSGIALRSRQIGAVGQWSHLLACAVRNALLRVVPSGVQMQQLAPIIGYEV